MEFVYHDSIKYRSQTNFENSAFLDDGSKEIETFKYSQTDSNMVFSI